MAMKEKESVLLSGQEAGLPVISGKLPSDLSDGMILTLYKETAED